MRIIAHRGDSANFPENTPAGWDAAYRDGAHAIEADIRLSSDGICICAHDPDLSRLFGRPERPEDLPLEELLRLRAADGGRIAPLTEVLCHAAAGKAVLLDLKDETPGALGQVWRAILDTVPEPQRRMVIAGCHTLDAVRFFAQRGHDAILGFVPTPDDAEAFRATGAATIRLWETDVTPERVARLHASGAAVWATAGGRGTGRPAGDISAENLIRLAQTGIDGVLVNDIGTTKHALENDP